MKKIPFDWAVKVSLYVLAAIVLYHLLIVTGIIPYTMTWGGRLQNREEMIQFELTSIFTNLFMIFVIAGKGKRIPTPLPTLLLNGFLWLFVLLFALNTVGNIVSFSIWEAIIFTPLTLFLGVMCVRIALEKGAQ